MKKTLLFLAAATLFASCSQINENIVIEPATEGLQFVGTIDPDGATKVLTASGVTTWKANDQISIFSVANGAAAGVSVSANKLYAASEDGATSGFAAIDATDKVLPANMYYAAYPGYATYPSKINASAAIGLTEQAANDPIDDYRYAYVCSNGTQAFVVDPATGLSVSNNPITMYGQGNAPANAGDPVQLTFKPVLPILEFGFTGETPIYNVDFEYVGETTYNQAENNFITGKGVVNLSTGALTTTNLSSTAAKKGTITFRTDVADATTVCSAALNETTPVRVQFVTGYMVATGGLKLTFYYDAASTVKATKTIWTAKTPDEVSMYDATAGKCKHIYQPVGVPSLFAAAPATAFAAAGGSQTINVRSTSAWSIKSKPAWITTLTPDSGNATTGTGTTVTVTAEASTSAARTGEVVLQNTEGVEYAVEFAQEAYVAQVADYYKFNVADLDWNTSYIHYLKNAESNNIAMITKEYLGATVNKQAIVVYPMTAGVADYTKGKVAEVTLDAGTAPTTDIHGGSISFTDMIPANAVYTVGTAAKATTIWIKADGSTIYFADPATGSETSSVGTLVADVLTTDVKSHPTVKIGTQIWLAENFKTTKFVDGTDITQYADGDAFWGTGDKALVIYDNDKVYLYNGYTVGYSGTSDINADDSNFAPNGWKVPSQSDYITDLLGFVGTNYTNLNNAFGATINYKATSSKTKVKVASLGYTNTWTTTATTTKGYMCGIKTDNAQVNAGQALTSAFSVRLIKE